MTSVAASAIAIIVALVLLIVLCMKGLNIIPTALLCTLIVGLTVPGGMGAGLYQFFVEGFGGFAGGLLPPFMTGGIFGALMMATGSDVKLGRSIVKAFGESLSVVALGIFVALLSYVGIASFPFLGAILAFSLMRASNLPRNIACVAMVGTASAFQFMFPGSPTIANIIPASVLGTNLFSGASIGIVMCIVQLIIVFFYIYRVLIKGYRAKGIGYTPTDMEVTLKGQAKEYTDEELPSFIVAVLPLVVVVVLCCVFQLAVGLNPYLSCVYAQLIGSILVVVLNLGRGSTKGLLRTLTSGCTSSCVPLIQTASVVGFASVVTSTSAYNAVMGAVNGLNMNPYVMVVLGTACLAAIAADPVSGETLSASTLGLRAIEMGAKPGLVHRLIAGAATTFDSMPHSGNLNVTMNFLGLSHKEVYGQIVVVQIGATSIATIVGMIIAMIIG